MRPSLTRATYRGRTSCDRRGGNGSRRDAVVHVVFICVLWRATSRIGLSRRSSGVLCTRWGSAHLSIGRCRPREVSSVAVHGRASRLVHHFVCEFNSLHFIQSPPRLPPFVMLHSCERLRFMRAGAPKSSTIMRSHREESVGPMTLKTGTAPKCHLSPWAEESGRRAEYAEKAPPLLKFPPTLT